MRFLLPLFLLALLSQLAVAKEEFFFVAAGEGIYRGGIDSETGKLAALSLVHEVKGANFLALAPEGKTLYVTRADSVAAFAVGKAGALTPLNEAPSGGVGSCFLSVDATGQNVFVANYRGASIACLRRKADGSLGKQTALKPLVGSGPDKDRQTQSYGHSVYPAPGNAFVYACDLGSDQVWIFKLDAAKGTLAPSDPPSGKVPPGSGPRHLAFSADGKFVYVANEIGHSVTTFARDEATGALTPLQTVSTLTSDTPVAGVTITTAEIALHPSGKWLYVSNRGCETISVLAVGADGTLSLLQSVPSPAKFPRQFTLDPSGHWMIVGGQKDTRLAVLKIDPATGRLSATDQTASVDAPMCVLFLN